MRIMETTCRAWYMYVCVCVAVLVTHAIIEVDASSSDYIEDDDSINYCQWQQFEASCPAGEVIVMTKALYGRMAYGRCVKRDYGYVGCKHDVLHQIDYRCSGRRHCTVEIPDKVFDASSRCPEDLRRYLQATYDCVPVVSATRQNCLSADYVITASSTVGYLASIVTDESGCGTADTPWVVRALPGQKLNITLHDFALSSAISNATTTRHAQSHRDHCHVYAIVKEQDGSRSYTICGGEQRLSHVYVSDTNSLEIRMLGGRNRGTERHYMLQYTAIGCADPDTPRGGWTKRIRNTVEGGCGSDSTPLWRITCTEGVWSGALGNCTAGDYPEALLSLGTLSHSTSLVLIIIIALFIGIVVLVVGLVCLKRYYPKRACQSNKAGMHTPMHQPLEPKYEPATTEYQKHRAQPLLNTHYQDASRQEENEYAYVEDIIPPHPPSSYPIDRVKDNMVHVDYSAANESVGRQQSIQSPQPSSVIGSPGIQSPQPNGMIGCQPIQSAHQIGGHYSYNTHDPKMSPYEESSMRPSVGPQPQYFVLAPNEREAPYSVNAQLQEAAAAAAAGGVHDGAYRHHDIMDSSAGVGGTHRVFAV